ncbi:MAG: ABC transporter ATP-binding protein, partial [Deltaproteobacteria bacterium]|nr:ABC transporter ATP-binding protein [Deltaproteobacteria bacterium]
AKLSFNEDRELKELPEKIEALEAEQQSLYKTMSDPALYRQGGQKASESKSRMEEIESRLEASYRRWEELEAKKKASE